MVTFELDMEYNRLSKGKAKEIKKLVSKKERDRQGLFIAEGEKCILDLIPGFNVKFLIATQDWLVSHPEISSGYSHEIFLADKRNLEIISSMNSLPQVIAVMEKPNEDLSGVPLLKKNKLYVLLDELQDPGNLGTIIRTCDWFGIYEIYASKNTVDVFGPKVVQATMGSLARVKVRYLDLKDLILKNRDIKVIGTLLDGKPLNMFNHKEEGMLLMGNEGKGISDELKNLIDIPLTVPPVNPDSHPDSLNVAIATAIIVSHFRP